VNEYSKLDNFRRQPIDTQGVLLQLNIADDYFKAKKQISDLEEELQVKENELYDLKHELISTQMKLESSQEQVKALQKAQNDDAKEIVRLETELKKK
jgi:cell division protein ZapA